MSHCASGRPFALSYSDFALGGGVRRRLVRGRPQRRAGGEQPRSRSSRCSASRWRAAITVTGTLAAEEQVMLSLKVTGRVDELLVDLGSPVQQGPGASRG